MVTIKPTLYYKEHFFLFIFISKANAIVCTLYRDCIFFNFQTLVTNLEYTAFTVKKLFFGE